MFSLAVGSHKQKYSLDGHPIDSVCEAKDLGVIVEKELKFSAHCSSLVKLAYQRSALIFKVFQNRDEKFMLGMLKVFGRSVIEHNAVVWSPRLVRDKHIIERVQANFLRRIPSLAQESCYANRLKKAGLESIEQRRVFFDLVETFRIVKGISPLMFDEFFVRASSSVTRGHTYKLKIPTRRTETRAGTLAVRAIEPWNKLPESIVSAPSVSAFKARLRKHSALQN